VGRGRLALPDGKELSFGLAKNAGMPIYEVGRLREFL
jgi:hypothetical protein